MTLPNPCVQAGATAVVPETLEPSLQLASAVLSQLNMPPDDVQEAIQEFRRAHMGELQVNHAAVALQSASLGEVEHRQPVGSKFHTCTSNWAIGRAALFLAEATPMVLS